ncbi:unnamed protein product [Mytilus coruscus]|uniref:Uncharacterized protein n=1 Tax=Mytilus coruscus TaxID=42192 RepID=A0A6J8DVI0_MYTCO|nr:unnamed protein product [Mytilus coruscus]
MNSYIERKISSELLPFSGMRNSAFVQYLDIANVLKTELKKCKTENFQEKNTNLEQQKVHRGLKTSTKEPTGYRIREISSSKNLKTFVNRKKKVFRELKEQVIEKDKTVKMVHDLYYLRSTEFSDEIQTLKKEKSDLHSKLQFHEYSIKQLTEELQSLRHENYMLSSSQNQQRPNYNNRHYNNRRGGRFR